MRRLPNDSPSPENCTLLILAARLDTRRSLAPGSPARRCAPWPTPNPPREHVPCAAQAWHDALRVAAEQAKVAPRAHRPGDPRRRQRRCLRRAHRLFSRGDEARPAGAGTPGRASTPQAPLATPTPAAPSPTSRWRSPGPPEGHGAGRRHHRAGSRTAVVVTPRPAPDVDPDQGLVPRPRRAPRLSALVGLRKGRTWEGYMQGIPR